MPAGFDLSQAMQTATQRAVGYMDRVLRVNDMAVHMVENEGNMVGKVTDLLDGSHVNNYDHLQIIKLYAHKHGASGQIVDGRV